MTFWTFPGILLSGFLLCPSCTAGREADLVNTLILVVVGLGVFLLPALGIIGWLLYRHRIS